ncbi:hypothetical protein BOSEA1005_20603 [Hyphomicrobiales bacterium]|nr:hypothetical protein BOSEA1005_20603 [Hyphomicrobiales bacterium]CAI0344780.1 hypothetical protein BO1005MUT1_350147 [Hyphomicrobiales bacterium]
MRPCARTDGSGKVRRACGRAEIPSVEIELRGCKTGKPALGSAPLVTPPRRLVAEP